MIIIIYYHIFIKLNLVFTNLLVQFYIEFFAV